MSVNLRTADTYQVMVYRSPGHDGTPGPPQPRVVVNEAGERKLEGVTFRSAGAYTGKTLMVMTDGSFRHITPRRPAGVSGRGRRNYRKHARRVAKLPNQPIESVGTSGAVSSVDSSGDNNNVNAVQE